ncbi:MAG: DAK2 domain-containing protein, partial [Actinobacteria bacterium]|nr:DAK2 domain-containing protein [Actinomycetota bacterium]
RTLDAVVAELDLAAPDLDTTCDAISHGSLMGARGNSGVTLSQILRGLASTLKHASSAGEATGTTVAAALKAAATAAYGAVLKPIEGTILTVARAAADGATSAAADQGSLAAVLRAARDAGREALARTPDMLPVLKEAGVVDAGGAGFMLLIDSALHVVDGEPLPEPSDDDGLTPAQFDAVAHRTSSDGSVDVSELRYEVMYFLDLDDASIDAFKQCWGEIGDSIVVVGGDGLWNCHVHTNDIGAAIEVALDVGGRPRQIRVTDLFEELADEHAHREAVMHGPGAPFSGPSTALPPVTCAVVAVASGDGLVELFGNLGVQGVVTGGQTLNPSTAELLDAVEAVNAQQVVVLPNNKNIIPVAEQLDALTGKAVLVVPTTSMPAALAALVVYDPEADASTNRSAMLDAIESVSTGEVTRAVRDTNSAAGPIVTGDWIGIVRGDGIVSVSGSLEGAAIALLDHLVLPSSEIVTLITGAGTTALQTANLVEWLHDERPGVEVEVHDGGQPLYPFLIGVE